MQKYIEGKKVEVLQELNSTQTIVREIFVDNEGNEIPHGESFTVTTSKLSDTPLSSWKESKLKQYELEWDKNDKVWRQKIENQERKLRDEYDKVYYLTKSVQGMAASLGNDASMAFIRLLDFMSGRINWVVINYWTPKVVHIDNFIDDYMFTRDRGIDGVKLLTLYGYPSCDGKHKGLKFNLNNYSDGSGSSTEIFVFHEEQEAIQKAREIIESKTYISEDTIKAAKEYGATLNPELLSKYWAERKQSIQKDIDVTIDKLTSYKAMLSEIEHGL